MAFVAWFVFLQDWNEKKKSRLRKWKITSNTRVSGKVENNTWIRKRPVLQLLLFLSPEITLLVRDGNGAWRGRRLVFPFLIPEIFYNSRLRLDHWRIIFYTPFLSLTGTGNSHPEFELRNCTTSLRKTNNFIKNF